MNKKNPIDYFIAISIIILVMGIAMDNKIINLLSFIALILGVIIKRIQKDNTNPIKIIEKSKSIKSENKKTQNRSSLETVQYFKEYIATWLQEEIQLFNEEYNYYINNCCPNCGCFLEQKIMSSKKCPECKKKIILRTNRLTSKKLILSENRAKEYDDHDKKRSEILYFEKIISGRQYVYSDYMNKFYELKSKASDPRNVVYPFVNYVGSQLDSIAYKKYMKIINLPESDMALESFEVIRQFQLATLQYFLLAEIADYKGKKEIALDSYATAAYRGVQISILDSIANPYHKMEIIDVMGNVFPGMILKFLKESGYSLEDFKSNFLEKRHPFILEQLSNEESWNYVNETIELYKKMESKNN